MFRYQTTKHVIKLQLKEKKEDKQETCRADQGYMKEYMKKRRANADFRKRENQNSMQKYNNFETIREKKKQTVTMQEGK